jgi:hypothetical protein
MTTLVETFRKIFDLRDKAPASLEAQTEAPTEAPEDLKKGQGN